MPTSSLVHLFIIRERRKRRYFLRNCCVVEVAVIYQKSELSKDLQNSDCTSEEKFIKKNKK